jgi:carbon monoxide dehydrogenase subunit G
MIEHDLRVGIDAPIDQVWDYVREMGNWAASMPGYREYEALDDTGTDTRWTLKVGAAALVRTVVVLVHVDRWDGPDRVTFTYRLDNDPVDGAGTYTAHRREDGGTDIALAITIRGQGPMAPVWEALAKPLLPKLARGFAEALKDKIEQISQSDDESSPVEDEKPKSAWSRLKIGRRS